MSAYQEKEAYSHARFDMQAEGGGGGGAVVGVEWGRGWGRKGQGRGREGAGMEQGNLLFFFST